jgi:hypothetical protein
LNGTKEGWTANARGETGREESERRPEEKKADDMAIRGTDQKIDTNSKENERLQGGGRRRADGIKEEDLVKPIVISP